VFQYPQNLALQYFPVGKWMTINLFLWYLVFLSYLQAISSANQGYLPWPSLRLPQLQ
jgi:hypothetical protein